MQLVALEQAHAVMALKCRYVLAQRRLRHAKPACCISVMQLLGEYDEFAIMLDLHGRPSPL